MKKFLTQLVDFDMTLYEVHDENYDPVKDIVDFWNKYDIKNFRAYMLELLIVYNGNPENSKLLFNTTQMQEFIIALVRMCMAYYIVPDRNIGLEKISIGLLGKSSTNDQELMLSKRIHDLFYRKS